MPPTIPRPPSESSVVLPSVTRSAVRRPRSIERWQTNVPDHAMDEGVRPAASSYLVVAFEASAGVPGRESPVASTIRDLCDGVTDGTHVEVVRLSDSGAAALERVSALVSQAFVGLGIVLVGPERHVYAARSVALAAGAEPAEIVCVCLDSESGGEDGVVWADASQPRNLFCAHCHALFTSEAAVGDAVTCPACGLLLAVHYNFSRRRAAYMATQVSTVGLANRGSQP